MNRSSFFIKNKALFGSFPSQDAVNELEKEGVRYFINLTCPGEKKTTQYTTNYEYINYPINDRNIPKNWGGFAKFIIQTCNIIKHLKPSEKIYLHCKGGHGRSGIAVACILVYYFNLSVKKALALTRKYHSKRKEMREKWRSIGSPQTYMQKNFVHKFFENISFDSSHSFLSIETLHNISIEGLGEFGNVKEAYAAGKMMFSEQNNWYAIKDQVMLTILYNKYSQNDDIKTMLLNTGLKSFVYIAKKEEYWGFDGKTGNNMLGKLLVKVRCKFLNE